MISFHGSLCKMLSVANFFFLVKLQQVIVEWPLVAPPGLAWPPWELQVDFVVVVRGRFWQPSFSKLQPGQLLHSTVDNFLI